MTRRVDIGPARAGGGGPLMVIAGPCVIENEEVVLVTARALRDICQGLGLPLVFKSSYDKANRTSVRSFRGPGLTEGLAVLRKVKEELGLPVISDVHSPEEAARAAEVLDALQIPAFLSRQTDIIAAAARTGKPVNVKKGQFLAPWDMKNVVEKFRAAGGVDLLLTERGTSFGYNNLVVDFRGLWHMRSYGHPVVFDVTHALQLPGGEGSSTGGQREFAAPLMRAAAAVGVDALFLETHPDPDKALCDGPNMIPLDEVAGMLRVARDVAALSRKALSSQ
ncbi:MAG: 3-deoxy-8-phosphooctulonate synthase [Nitrospirota bacterium]